MGYTRKIDEFDPVFSLQKIEKGWFYKTRGIAYSCNFFLKMGYSTKHYYCRLWDFALVVVTYILSQGTEENSKVKPSVAYFLSNF